MKFHETPWTELKNVDKESTLLLFPVGSCEQHGPHLPTFTDSLEAQAVAEGVESRMSDRVLMLPTLWVGASEHHLPFGGTLTVRTETHITLLIELLQPLLADGYRRLLILNSHGGNTDTIHVALRRLQQEFPDVLLTGAGFWDLAAKELAALCESPQDGPWHAGEVETSLIKTIRPDLVRETTDLKDCDRPLPDVLRGLYISRDMAQSTQDGFLGYPSQGTAEKGEKFLEASVTRVVEVCEELLTMDLPRVRTPKTD